MTQQGAASADAIEAKRAEAARLTDDIQAHAQRIVASNQRYRQAQARLADIQASLRQAQTGVNAALEQQAQARARLQAQAIQAYTHGGSVGVLGKRLRARSDLVLYDTYLGLLGGIDRTTLESLRGAREDLEARRATLNQTAGLASSEVSRVDADRAALRGAEAAQEAVLRQVNGEVGALVAAEQVRRAAEAQRAAAAPRMAAKQAPANAPGAPRTGAAPVKAAPSGGSGDPWTCIKQLESGNNYATPGGGAYQFQDATWRAMGGTGSAQNASPEEQDMRARKLQAQEGWRPWTTARRCGLL